MADAVLGILLEKLGNMALDKLETMALDELRSLKDVREELKKLESALSAIQSVLEDAEARKKKDKALEDWLKKLKDVAYDIDDVLDEAAVEAHQFKRKEMVRKSLSFPKSLLFRHKIAKKIKKIRERLDTISDERLKFHLREGAVRDSQMRDSEIKTGGLRESGSVGDSQVYGRDEDKKQIIDFLLNRCNEKNPGVISIVGLGGLGKTTLAQLVYNDDGQVSQHFPDYKIWVHVSEKFEIENVITSIIESLTKKKYELSSRALMEQELLKQIKGQRFLLVLDDIWTKDCWNSLERFLKHGANGSKVIVTTRSRDVADVMKSNELHILSGLPDEDCWKLFENRAFVHGVNADNKNLVAIGKEIVKKCGGLPLAAKALGSALFKREESHWRKVRDNEIWTLFKEDQDILPALMLSYNHLLPHLKKCFSYCSIFPKGTEIKIEMLVQLWLAEGFVGLSDGSWYVDQLISMSLLENVREDEYVKMHDMVHNLAQFVAGDECSIVDATSRCTTSVSQNSRYTSLFLDKATPSTAPILTSGHNLRTLHLIRKSFYYGEEEDIYCQQVLDTIFSNMKLLRALHLPGLSIKELPATMKKLVHLRYLNLSSTKLRGLPQTIGLLQNMQTLQLHSSYLQTLPESIGDLVNLLTLDISHCRGFHSLPDTIGKLVHLQKLNLSYTTLQTLPPTIVTLQNLQTLHLSNCVRLADLPKSIGGLVNLLTLDLTSCESLHYLPDTIGKLVHLQHLDLSSTKLQTLPPTIGTLHNLQTLHLSNCVRLADLPKSIGGLGNLLTLDLTSCKSLHFLPATIDKLVHLQHLDLSSTKLQTLPPTIGTLHNLQTLHLSNCVQLADLPKSIGGLVNLLTLDLTCCESLHSLPNTIGKLVHLQYLDLSSTKLQTLPPTIGTLHNLQTLNLNFCVQLEMLPESIGGLANLLKLDLGICKSLHSLPEGIGKLVHLQWLRLSKTNLQTLPPTIGTLHNLQTLDLSHCVELADLHESIGGLVNLLILHLIGCKSLHSLPETIGKLVHLQHLDLSNTKLQTLPPTIGTLHNLQTLYLVECDELEMLPESMSSLYNLQTLHLDSCYMLRELPKNIQSMRSLTHLNIHGCDSLTSIPAGIGQLSQLQMLPMYVLGDGENDASLAELGTLMNLEGRLLIKNLQNVKDVAEASAANLREKQSINSLGLEWDFDADWTDENYEDIDDFEKKRKTLVERVAAMDGEHVRLLEDVSSSLQPHQNIEVLRIKGYVGKMLPGWMMDIPVAPFLVELKLESFARCVNLQALEQLSCLGVMELKRFPFIECLPRLGQLPRLRVLRLYMLPGVKCLGSEFYGGAGAFPALHELELEFMLGLKEWSRNADEEEDAFLPRLSKLVLRDCPKLQALPSTFPSVVWLKMNADDELLLCVERSALPNPRFLIVGNCVDNEDESSMPEALVQLLHSVRRPCKLEKLTKWDHSWFKLEKMRLETLERIATEIEKKLAIKPSS